MDSVIVHYQEIALKGRNRPWFIRQLVRNIREATADLRVGVRAIVGRIELTLPPRAEWEVVRERLGRVFGVGNFARSRRTTTNVDEIAAAILGELQDVDVDSFRVSARRADKRFPLTSPQIEREVGGRIKMAKGWRVDLSHPALTIRVEVLTHDAFFFVAKERGPGGLPTGASGRVACLLSGGIDSPVAAWRMMRRGCRVHLIHFHGYPVVSRTSMEKARELAEVLTRYQLRSKLWLVAFGEIQRQVVLAVPPPLRVVVYRRLMVRIAETIARSAQARALVTGEVVGQVASQTLENLTVIDAAATMPVLRPLIGMDKEEIVEQARRLGTYQISIVPDEDCCQLFTPKHPSTRARLAEVEAVEQALPMDEFVGRVARNAVVEQFRFPI
jgi:thiamine biosynthesis protein ThiI